MASSDTDSTSSWVTFGKKDTLTGDRISVSDTQPVHGYRSQNLQLDGRIGEQYFEDALLRSCLGYLLPNPTIKSKHVVSDITQ